MHACLPLDTRSAPRKSSKLKWIERERVVDVARAHHPLDESEDDSSSELEGNLRLESKRKGKKKPKAAGKHPRHAEADDLAPDASEDDAGIESEQFLRKERPRRGKAHEAKPGSGKAKKKGASRAPTSRAPKSLRCSKSRRRLCRRCALAVAGLFLAVQGIVMVFAPSTLQLWLDGVLPGPADVSGPEAVPRNFSTSNAYGHVLSFKPTAPPCPPPASPAPSRSSEDLVPSLNLTLSRPGHPPRPPLAPPPSFTIPRPGHPPKPPPFSSPADFNSSIGGQPMEKV